MSDIIFTPPVSGGGGTTINPTNKYIPVRSNATTFIDSFLQNDITFLKTIYGIKNVGLFCDFANKNYKFGSYNADSITYLEVDDAGYEVKTTLQNQSAGFYANNNGGIDARLGDYFFQNFGTMIQVLDANKVIRTWCSFQQNGLKLDFNTNNYLFGDFNNVSNGTSLTIDNGNSLIRTYFNAIRKGLQLDNTNEQFAIGDFDAVTNGNYIIVDNSGVEEVIICANKQLNIKGNFIQANGTKTYANENLQVKAPDGNIYFIPLYT